MAATRSMEAPFWPSILLAVVLWILILWGFGFFLATPKLHLLPAAPPMPIDARFVELPEPAPAQPAQPASKSRPVARLKLRVQVPVPPPSSTAEPTPPIENTPPPPPARENPAPAPDAAPTDMMSYVNAARARRQAAEAREAEAAGEAHQPTADEMRSANIMRNLQTSGTNGIFQILDVGVRTARFSFRAWTLDPGNQSRQTIEVDAGPAGNVELAVVRRMIELIRTYYQGDFNWESQRVGRVVLSARKEDTAQLEDFLMREFFGVGVKNQAQ